MDIWVLKRLDTDFYVFIGNNEDNFLKNEFNIKEAEYDWIQSFIEELTVDLPGRTLNNHVEVTVLKNL